MNHYHVPVSLRIAALVAMFGYLAILATPVFAAYLLVTSGPDSAAQALLGGWLFSALSISIHNSMHEDNVLENEIRQRKAKAREDSTNV